jgi:hypothetical protein
MGIAPGIHSVGQEQGGHVHACLLDDGSGLADALRWRRRGHLARGRARLAWPHARQRQNLQSARQLPDFGDADILGVGHGEPVVGDAAVRPGDLLS